MVATREAITETQIKMDDAKKTSAFPPCTSVECTVDEDEKERVSQQLSTTQQNSNTCAMTERCVQSCAAYGRVCPCAARIAAHAACEAIQELKEQSHLFGTSATNTNEQHPYLNANDIMIGKKLGQGGFSNVNECTVLKHGVEEAGQEFAVKYLKKRAMVDLHTFKHGAADLAVEAFFLEALDHPHIIKLHGVTAGSVESAFESGKECGFFIVVDRLTHTLEEQLERWREEEADSGSHGLGLMRLSSEYKHRKKAELLGRIKMALDIASAMAYMHSKHIIFRDLKPDNIGFDEHGVLKLFDYGLAKELKPGMKNAQGTYNLTGNTGSRRYMAPEIAKERPYNHKVDVFSFGILLWELCSAEKPFYGYSSGKHMQQVVIGGERPKMDSHHTAYWPHNLQLLITRCWSAMPDQRPEFEVIQQVLQDILDGKDDIPASLAGPLEIERAKQTLSPPSSGFGGLLHPLSRRKNRHKTTPVIEANSPPKSTRARSWGFGR